jgi:hypothetical protein
MGKEVKIENQKDLRRLLNKPYELSNWKLILEFVLPNVQFFETSQNLLNDIKLTDDERSILREFNQIGYCVVKDSKDEIKQLGLFEIKLVQKNYIYNQKEILRKIIGKFISPSDTPGIISVIDSNNTSYRFSFAAKKVTMGDDGEIYEEETDTKKFTYLVGKDESCHTPAERLFYLHQNLTKINLDKVIEAFKVDTLSKDFFNRYTEVYKDFVQYITGKRVEKSGGKWKDMKKSHSAEGKRLHKLVFNNDDKAARDYVKILLGRLVFIKFLEKKGWIGADVNDDKWQSGDKNFILNQFNNSKYKDNFHSKFLVPLFKNAFNKDGRPNQIFSLTNTRVPYLDGGLFQDVNPNVKELDFEKELFENLLNFFDEYNFTIDENNKDDQEVGIDPEMLGHIFENLLEDNKEKGAFYTPKPVVEYMCQESIVEYLNSYIKEVGQMPAYVSEQKEIKNGLGLFVKAKMAEKILDYRRIICEGLHKVKICDPAIGSGAFPIGILKEIFDCVKFLFDLSPDYVGEVWGFVKGENGYIWNASKVKQQIIQNSIYGVDIEKGAVDIARLRFWLSIIVDEKIPSPLPSLNYKVVVGDSLDGFPYVSDVTYKDLNQVKLLKQKIFDPENKDDKETLIVDTEKLFEKIYTQDSKALGRTVRFDLKMHFSEIFDGTHSKNGFDIIIANPPYVNTKQISDGTRKILDSNFKWVDDLYNHFTIKAFDYVRENGVITFITSDTFLTLKSKANMRKKLLENELIRVVPTPKTFSAMVDTAIFMVKKKLMESSYNLDYIDIRTPNFSKLNIPDDLLLSTDLTTWEVILEPLFNALKFKREYTKEVPVSLYRNNLNMVIFSPTNINLQIRFKVIPKIIPLYTEWWEKIETSREIERNKASTKRYRDNLRAGDLTLLGLVTEGGQGLATANNGKFVGCLEGTKLANNIKESRSQKLFDAFEQYPDLYKKITKFSTCTNKKDFAVQLNKLSENKIRELFEEIKEDKGRDVFGQGYLYRIISKDEIANVSKLNASEKELGVSNNRKDCYVLYDKGDRDGNRWFLESPYYLCWNQKTVEWFRQNSGKKGEGMPVLRNPQFYFKEGFCWSDIQTTYLKCRFKKKSVHDVKSMSLFSTNEKELPNEYFICIINSKFISEFQQEFLNNTPSFQINDARMLPIVVPNAKELNTFLQIFENAIEIKKKQFGEIITYDKAESELSKVQTDLDNAIYSLYNIDPLTEYIVQHGAEHEFKTVKNDLFANVIK